MLRTPKLLKKQWHENAQLSAAGNLRQSSNWEGEYSWLEYPTGCPIVLALILCNNLFGKDFGTTCRFKVAYLKGLSELIYLHTIVYIFDA